MSTTVSTLLAYAEIKSQSGTGTLNNSTGLAFLNEALLDYRTRLIRRNIDASQLQEAYVPTVTVPTYPSTSTFAYPDDMFILKTIEVNMLDATQQNYLAATQVDVSNIPGGASYDYIRKNQLTTEPLFDDRGDTYEIFPTFTSGMNLTNAIKLIYFLAPTPYATTSDNLAYPDTLNWYALAMKVASLYYESLNKFAEATNWEGKFLEKIAEMTVSLGAGSQQPIQPQPLPVTGWNL